VAQIFLDHPETLWDMLVLKLPKLVPIRFLEPRVAAEGIGLRRGRGGGTLSAVAAGA
jgi:hypothetical protein